MFTLKCTKLSNHEKYQFPFPPFPKIQRILRWATWAQLFFKISTSAMYCILYWLVGIDWKGFVCQTDCLFLNCQTTIHPQPTSLPLFLRALSWVSPCSRHLLVKPRSEHITLITLKDTIFLWYLHKAFVDWLQRDTHWNLSSIV